MFICYGTEMFGGTDAVPGLFYVQTKFYHIYFLPLCPIQTYLVFQGRTDGGVKIPVSWKSILVAWLRCIGGLFVLFTLVVLLLVLTDDPDLLSILTDDPDLLIGHEPTIFASVLFVLACGLQHLLMTHGSLRNASHERAGELCSALGPTGGAALRLLVDRHFQQRFGIATAVAVFQDDDGDGEEECGSGGGEAFHDLEFAEIFPSDDDEAAPEGKRETDGGGQLPTAKVLEVV